jgi:hypothetical protein
MPDWGAGYPPESPAGLVPDSGAGWDRITHPRGAMRGLIKKYLKKT